MANTEIYAVQLVQHVQLGVELNVLNVLHRWHGMSGQVLPSGPSASHRKRNAHVDLGIGLTTRPSWLLESGAVAVGQVTSVASRTDVSVG